MDARNHGDSPHTPEMSYELMCQDLVQFMKTQNMKKCIIVGGGNSYSIIIIIYIPA